MLPIKRFEFFLLNLNQPIKIVLGRLKCYKYLLLFIKKRFNYLKKYYAVMRSFQRTAYAICKIPTKMLFFYWSLVVDFWVYFWYPWVPLTEHAKPKMLYKDFEIKSYHATSQTEFRDKDLCNEKYVLYWN